MPKNNLKLADDFASDYDDSVLKNNWNGPKVIYELAKNILNPSSKILDIGIGTGESSKRFEKAGHKITGIDGSANMLEQCRKKNIGANLILHNLEETPFPLKNNQFDVVISNGVFHLIYPLKPVFSEIERIIISDGFYSFTYENTDDKNEYEEIQPGIWQRKTKTGVLTYKYEDNLVSEYLNTNNFEILSKKKFIAFTNKQEAKDIYFTAVLAKKL